MTTKELCVNETKETYFLFFLWAKQKLVLLDLLELILLHYFIITLILRLLINQQSLNPIQTISLKNVKIYHPSQI